VIATVALVRARRNTTAALLARMPAGSAVILSIDFGALRSSGVLSLLASSQMMQEPEYRVFVEQTGFDYLTDLDSALVSFHPNGTFLLLRGRFDWKNLKEYTAHQGGFCYNTLCRVAGSTPRRKISFFPLQSGTMALAVSDDDSAAARLQAAGVKRALDIPEEPVWALVPVGALRDSDAVPPGTRAFARALGTAETVVFAAGLDGRRIQLRMDAACRTPSAAAALTTQLRDTTARLRELIAREHQTPSARDLSGVLAAGAFEQSGARVLGRWPIPRELLENIAGGSL
jgi:hypothetical protein